MMDNGLDLRMGKTKYKPNIKRDVVKWSYSLCYRIGIPPPNNENAIGSRSPVQKKKNKNKKSPRYSRADQLDRKSVV